MIKINLLRERAVEQPIVRVPIEPKPIQAILIIVVLFVAAVALGTWYWWSKHSELVEKRQKVANLQKEADRLEAIRQEVLKYQKTIAVLKKRTEIIQRLKDNQVGPVNMMDALIQSLPAKNPKLWFNKVESSVDESGESTHIVGFSFNVNAIADFYSKLKQKKYFTSIDWLYYDKTKKPIKFEFKCRRENKKQSEQEDKNG